jgi:UDP-N-acetylglucosamine/UDP-N-acetylgalactosamine diphosphorylase
VLEYSELDHAKAAAVDPSTGKLYYNWSNICMHYFALPWLQSAAQQLEQAAAYHIAHKQIPEKSGGKVPGVKLEMFVFDPFHSAKDVTLFEVRRGCQPTAYVFFVSVCTGCLHAGVCLTVWGLAAG